MGFLVSESCDRSLGSARGASGALRRRLLPVAALLATVRLGLVSCVTFDPSHRESTVHGIFNSASTPVFTSSESSPINLTSDVNSGSEPLVHTPEITAHRVTPPKARNSGKSLPSWDYAHHGADWTSGMCRIGMLQSPVDLHVDGLVTRRRENLKEVFESVLKGHPSPESIADGWKRGDVVYSYRHLISSVQVMRTDKLFRLSVPSTEGSTFGALFTTDRPNLYMATHIEFHSPSEHTFDGSANRRQVEVQIWHYYGDESDADSGISSIEKNETTDMNVVVNSDEVAGSDSDEKDGDHKPSTHSEHAIHDHSDHHHSHSHHHHGHHSHHGHHGHADDHTSHGKVETSSSGETSKVAPASPASHEPTSKPDHGATAASSGAKHTGSGTPSTESSVAEPVISATEIKEPASTVAAPSSAVKATEPKEPATPAPEASSDTTAATPEPEKATSETAAATSSTSEVPATGTTSTESTSTESTESPKTESSTTSAESTASETSSTAAATAADTTKADEKPHEDSSTTTTTITTESSTAESKDTASTSEDDTSAKNTSDSGVTSATTDESTASETPKAEESSEGSSDKAAETSESKPEERSSEVSKASDKKSEESKPDGSATKPEAAADASTTTPSTTSPDHNKDATPATTSEVDSDAELGDDDIEKHIDALEKNHINSDDDDDDEFKDFDFDSDDDTVSFIEVLSDVTMADGSHVISPSGRRGASSTSTQRGADRGSRSSGPRQKLQSAIKKAVKTAGAKGAKKSPHPLGTAASGLYSDMVENEQFELLNKYLLDHLHNSAYDKTSERAHLSEKMHARKTNSHWGRWAVLSLTFMSEEMEKTKIETLKSFPSERFMEQVLKVGSQADLTDESAHSSVGELNSENQSDLPVVELDTPINLSSVLMMLETKNLSYFAYDGSFTRPGCEETVRWYVAKEPLPVSTELMLQIHRMLNQTRDQSATAEPISKYRELQNVNGNLHNAGKVHLVHAYPMEYFIATSFDHPREPTPVPESHSALSLTVMYVATVVMAFACL